MFYGQRILGIENLGYDLKFDEGTAKAVGTYGDCHGKERDFRGQGLQRKMMEESEQITERTGISLSAWNGTFRTMWQIFGIHS